VPYRDVAALLNPRNDADDIAASLTRLNFSANKVIDGPFDDMRRALLHRGLVRVEPPDNVLVAYAPRGGTVASDDDGKRSPFTAAP
jgi:uncharacterized caspase-like protein